MNATQFNEITEQQRLEALAICERMQATLAELARIFAAASRLGEAREQTK